jgi:hypothetical protein
MNKSDYQNLHYVGSFSTLQTEGNSQYMNHGAISLNKIQGDLYSRLLKGLKHYSKEELYTMNSNKKRRIKKANEKAQELLNLWKQELMIANTNAWFDNYNLKLNSSTTDKKAVKTLLSSLPSQTDPKFTCTLSFKDLGINKEKIVNKFLEARLLPANFMELA